MAERPPDTSPPLLIVVSGPSGVGKDAVMAQLLEHDSFVRPITMTTRPPRAGEVDGVDYHFASSASFAEAVTNGELLEHAEVHGRSYGTPRAEVQRALESGRDVLLQVDVQGAEALRGVLRGALFVFIAPESLEQLEGRLRERRTEDAELERRLVSARREMEAQPRFDRTVVNYEGDLDGTVAALLALIEAERARPDRTSVEMGDPASPSVD